MRNLTDHIVEGDSANHQLTIEVKDEPGQGGANHEYSIGMFGKFEAGVRAPLHRLQNIEVLPDGSVTGELCHISFQNGPIKEFGVNGVTQEALLAIVIDRLESFQAGPFACDDNAIAPWHCRIALDRLQKRTRARIARGVEGTHEK
jgi:hypothetical protein